MRNSTPEDDKKRADARIAYERQYYKDHFKEKMAYQVMRNQKIKDGTWWRLNESTD